MPIVRTPPDFALDALGDCALHIVLVEPEIPQNTGNIARLCAGAYAWLHLVEPFAFKLEDKYVRRAGLDYWPSVRLSVHPSLDALEAMLPFDRTVFFTKGADHLYRTPTYERGAVLVFGCETRGLPQRLTDAHADRCVRIPTSSNVRSLNLANSVAIGTYEVLRQLDWDGETPMPS